MREMPPYFGGTVSIFDVKIAAVSWPCPNNFCAKFWQFEAKKFKSFSLFDITTISVVF